MTLRGAHQLDQLAPLRAARRPQLLVGDARRRRPRSPGRRARSCQPSPRWRSSSVAHRPPSHVGMCTPLVTWAIGTSSSGRSGHRSRHISRATSPWRALTPLAMRLERSANCVTPNGSASSSGRVRPAAHQLVDVDAHLAGDARQHAGHLVGRVGVVAGRHRGVRGEDGAAPDGLERLVGRAAVGLAGRSAPARAHASAAWPSLRCTTPGSTPSACSARTPPMPSSAYWARRSVGVAHVQARGDPAVGDVVLGPVGVEQQQRHAADVDAPDLGDDLPVADRAR